MLKNIKPLYFYLFLFSLCLFHILFSQLGILKGSSFSLHWDWHYYLNSYHFFIESFQNGTFPSIWNMYRPPFGEIELKNYLHANNIIHTLIYWFSLKIYSLFEPNLTSYQAPYRLFIIIKFVFIFIPSLFYLIREYTKDIAYQFFILISCLYANYFLGFDYLVFSSLDFIPLFLIATKKFFNKENDRFAANSIIAISLVLNINFIHLNSLSNFIILYSLLNFNLINKNKKQFFKILFLSFVFSIPFIAPGIFIKIIGSKYDVFMNRTDDFIFANIEFYKSFFQDLSFTNHWKTTGLNYFYNLAQSLEVAGLNENSQESIFTTLYLGIPAIVLVLFSLLTNRDKQLYKVIGIIGLGVFSTTNFGDSLIAFFPFGFFNPLYSIGSKHIHMLNFYISFFYIYLIFTCLKEYTDSKPSNKQLCLWFFLNFIIGCFALTLDFNFQQKLFYILAYSLTPFSLFTYKQYKDTESFKVFLFIPLLFSAYVFQQKVSSDNEYGNTKTSFQKGGFQNKNKKKIQHLSPYVFANYIPPRYSQSIDYFTKEIKYDLYQDLEFSLRHFSPNVPRLNHMHFQNYIENYSGPLDLYSLSEGSNTLESKEFNFKIYPSQVLHTSFHENFKIVKIKLANPIYSFSTNPFLRPKPEISARDTSNNIYKPVFFNDFSGPFQIQINYESNNFFKISLPKIYNISKTETLTVRVEDFFHPRIKVSNINHEDVQFEITPKESGYLLLRINYDTNFEAYVDNSLTKIERWNEQFIKISINKDNKTVHISFKNDMLKSFLFIGYFLQILLTITLAILFFRKNSHERILQ